ncbi:hypothetical protein CPB86DRAFT_289671 [Serendipita vermifera]|nr:hypothetical protein CPB86DRAFT_289671 [Serendipita vermifera]
MLFLAESLIRHTNHNRTSYLSLSFSQLYPLLLFALATTLPVVKAQQGLIQNVTVSSADPSIQYTPTNEWFPAVVTNGVDGSTLSFMQSIVFNASIAFTITEPSTALYWRGFLPTTPARYSVCIDCPNPATDLGDVVTLGQADLGSNGSNNTAVILYANERLQNTTHTIVIRNIRNDIEGVVGRLSLDAFLYSTSVLGILCAPSFPPIWYQPLCSR